MRTGWTGFGSPLLAVLLVLMVSLVLVVLWQVRNNQFPVAQAGVRAAAAVGLAAGAAGTTMVTQVSWTPRYHIDRVDLNPFDDFATLFTSPTTGSQFLANLALLSWLGFFLPLTAPRLASRRCAGAAMLLLGLATAGLIEFGQLMWSSGRVSSVSDVLINGTGVFLGYLISRAALSLWRQQVVSCKPQPQIAAANCSRDQQHG